MISYLYNKTKKLKSEGKRIWPWFYKFAKAYINVVYPLIAGFNKKSGIEKKSNIVVSLTSYPARINTVWLTVATLLNQTHKPSDVILWLSEEQFKGRELPKKLIKLKRRGLEIKFCDDLKPHKKYYYAIQEFPKKIIITADDDIFYPEDHIEKLWDMHLKYPQCVICNEMQSIAVDNDDFLTYDQWPKKIIGSNPGILILPIGANGVLYPPNSLDEEVLNKEKLIECALYTDDLWLKCMEIKKDVSAYVTDSTSLAYFNNIRTMKTGLWRANVTNEHRNDTSWKLIMDMYPEIKEKILKYSRQNK